MGLSNLHPHRPLLPVSAAPTLALSWQQQFAEQKFLLKAPFLQIPKVDLSLLKNAVGGLLHVFVCHV